MKEGDEGVADNFALTCGNRPAAAADEAAYAEDEDEDKDDGAEVADASTPETSAKRPMRDEASTAPRPRPASRTCPPACANIDPAVLPRPRPCSSGRPSSDISDCSARITRRSASNADARTLPRLLFSYFMILLKLCFIN